MEQARVEARVSCVAIIHRILHLVLQLDPMYRRSNDNDGTEVNTPSAWGEHRAPSGMVVSVVDMHSLVSSALVPCASSRCGRPMIRLDCCCHTIQLVLGCGVLRKGAKRSVSLRALTNGSMRSRFECRILGSPYCVLCTLQMCTFRDISIMLEREKVISLLPSLSTLCL